MLERASCLFGENGSGKSTIIKLLMRAYDPDEGIILFDDIDVRKLDYSKLQSQMSGVFQEYIRMETTVSLAIQLGQYPSTDDEIEIAAKRAGAHDFISSLKNSYDTEISMRDNRFKTRDMIDAPVSLSGGQFQRLALARSFLRQQAKLFIFDEPSSSLDPEAEAKLFKNLVQLVRKRTCLWVTHRFQTVGMADRVMLLDHGKLCEFGTHDELMREDGKYKSFYLLQRDGFFNDDVKVFITVKSWGEDEGDEVKLEQSDLASIDAVKSKIERYLSVEVDSIYNTNKGRIRDVESIENGGQYWYKTK
ncbi:mitochondrial potassium channel ATP-binding subunit [Acrasis kona]|uniref:Mitochondrial potassium channel ATP-binding subunit n=1 Tax=Acrasis kona TaxID=1008807 RepID=A0AAW2Z8X6_9EUKA